MPGVVERTAQCDASSLYNREEQGTATATGAAGAAWKCASWELGPLHGEVPQARREIRRQQVPNFASTLPDINFCDVPVETVT
jgi:hypothetical protein